MLRYRAVAQQGQAMFIFLCGIAVWVSPSVPPAATATTPLRPLTVIGTSLTQVP